MNWFFRLYEGRIEQKDYLLLMGIGLFIYFAFVLFLWSYLGASFGALKLRTLAYYAMAIFFFCPLHVRRMHDIGISGGWAIVCFVPLIGIIFTLMMCASLLFAPGEKEKNRFGLASSSGRSLFQTFLNT